MKKISFLFIILVFHASFGQIKNLSLTLINSELIKADYCIGSDAYENQYFIEGNILFKKKQGELWQYKNLSLGKITHVDFQNPLKIILLYENFNTIIMLDNQLNEIQKINFSENNIPTIVTATGIASQNRLWIYNSLSQQIGLFDYLKNTFQSITLPFKGNLKYYESDFNHFQWIDENLNWLACDVFGKVTVLGKVPDFDQFQTITNQTFLFSKDGKLYLRDSGKNITYKIINVENSFKKFHYKDQILSIFTTTEITNYKIITP
jgi:hypothetical protein